MPLELTEQEIAALAIDEREDTVLVGAAEYGVPQPPTAAYLKALDRRSNRELLLRGLPGRFVQDPHALGAVVVKLGRVFSITLLSSVSALILLATIWPDLMHLGPIHVVDWIGLLIFISAPLTWLLALWHWARHYPHEGPRIVWGFVVVLGFVPGALVYWFAGAASGSTAEADARPPAG